MDPMKRGGGGGDSNSFFKTALSHDSGYSISHTHASPILSICLILWQLLPFSLQTLLHQGLWAFQGKQRCHSWSHSLIYGISNSILVLEWWLPLIQDLIYLKVPQWHLQPWTEVEIKERERDGENKEHWSGETKCKIEVKSCNYWEADTERDEIGEAGDGEKKDSGRLTPSCSVCEWPSDIYTHLCAHNCCSCTGQTSMEKGLK